jgi:chromosome segregation ATPase
MAVWLPVLKAALPYVSNIVAAALPAFTQRKSAEAAGAADLVTQQIAELQTAVTSNAAALKTLAEQVEKTLTALDGSETDLAQRLAQQLASVQETVARCESTASQAQAQATRLDGLTAALQMRTEELQHHFARHQTESRNRFGMLTLVALLALLLAILALIR